VNGIMAVVAGHGRAGADQCPDIFNRAFLTDPGFIPGSSPGQALEPNFNLLAGHPCRQNIQAQATEVFLKVSCAARSFLG
jgi:hypothetical protein